jgi:hypothetical protein
MELEVLLFVLSLGVAAVIEITLTHQKREKERRQARRNDAELSVNIFIDLKQFNDFIDPHSFNDDEISEAYNQLVDIVLDRNLMLTPTQRLMMAIGSQFAAMELSVHKYSQNNKCALEAFIEFNKNGGKASPSKSFNKIFGSTTDDEYKKKIFDLIEKFNGCEY